MTKNQWSRAVTVTGALLVALALVLGLTPSPAGSATSSVSRARAEAKALTLEIAGSEILLGDPRIAQTPPVPPSVTGSTTGGTLELPLLGQILAAGVAGQDAAVDLDGNSAACSGLVAPGGQINVSSVEPPTCNVSPGPNGLVVNLTGLGLVRLRLDAIYASCSASAGGTPVAGVEAVDLAVDTFNALNIFDPWQEQVRLNGPVAPNTSIPLVDALGGIVNLTLNEQPAVPTPGVAEATALHLTILNALLPGVGLIDLEVGKVKCGVNSSSVASIDFDTSGSLGDNAVQPNTDNALALSYSTDVDRPNVTLEARLNDPVGVMVDPDRPLPTGCTVSIDGQPDPDEQIIICQMGPVLAGDTVSAVIPVEITEDAADVVTAELSVYGTSVADELVPTFEESAAVHVERTSVAGDAGDLVVPDPNRTGLPEDIPGTLYLDVPHYVEQAAYGGTPCTLDPAFDPEPTVYPAVQASPANVTFDCGSAIPASPGSADALAFTYADDAPETAGTPDLGRVLIIRDAPGALPEVPGNSYYADLDFFVNEAAPVTTTSSSTTSTTAGGSTTSTTAGGSTTSTTAGSSTTSTAPDGSTTSTTPDSTTSSTAAVTSSSTSSTVGAGGGTTTTKARPLARTGSDTRMTMSIALGLLGAGMVVTGRGMQAEVSILSRRRRS